MKPRDLIRGLVKEAIEKTGIFNKFRTHPKVIEFVKGKSDSELIHSDFWDKLAFGFTNGSTIRLPINKLKIKYRDDMLNVNGFSMKKYFNGKPFESLPPIEVSYDNGKFYIEDGHHRYGYAKELGLSHVNVIVDVKNNPFKTLGFGIDDVVELRNSLKQSSTDSR